MLVVLIAALSAAASGQQTHTRGQEVMIAKSLNTYDDKTLGGINLILRYTEAAPSRNITRIEMFTKYTDLGNERLEKVQIEHHGKEIDVADIEAADCNLSLVRIVRYRNVIYLIVSRRNDIHDLELSQDNSAERSISLFKLISGSDPGDSSLMFVNVLDYTTKTKLCTAKQVSASISEFVKNKLESE